MKHTLPLLWLFFIILPTITIAQEHFTHKTAPFMAAKTGYNRIELSTDIVNSLSADFGNLRLFNSNRQEIPYVLQGELPLQHSCSPIAMSFYSKINKEGRKTEIVFENTPRKDVDNLTITTQAFNGEKNLQLYGSNDHEQWEILKENWVIGQNTTFTAYHFRRTNYRYFKISIDDFDSSPIHIDKMTYQSSIFPNESYNVLGNIPFSLSQEIKGKDTITYAEIVLENPQYIHWIDLQVECASPRYAYNIEIQTKQAPTDFYTHYQTTQLTSHLPLYLTFNKLYAKYIRLKIPHYHHRQPAIMGIQLYQLRYFLVANLQAQQPYQLFFGGHTTHAPRYTDLFDQQIMGQVEETIYPTKISAVHTKSILNLDATSGSNALSLWLIVGIGVVCAVLLTIGWVVWRKTRNVVVR